MPPAFGEIEELTGAGHLPVESLYLELWGDRGAGRREIEELTSISWGS